MPVTPFEAKKTSIAGLFVVEMKQIDDERGVVREFFRMSEFEGSLLPDPSPWKQINITETKRGAIRGLHGEYMNKFVTVAAGAATGVYLDVRKGSATYGLTETVHLQPGVGVFVSEGICNGFQATGPGPTQYCYCFDEEWSPTMPGVSVNALDPELGIEWPILIDVDDRSLISEKDVSLPPFRAL